MPVLTLYKTTWKLHMTWLIILIKHFQVSKHFLEIKRCSKKYLVMALITRLRKKHFKLIIEKIKKNNKLVINVIYKKLVYYTGTPKRDL